MQLSLRSQNEIPVDYLGPKSNDKGLYETRREGMEGEKEKKAMWS